MFAAPGHTRMISHYCCQHVSDRLDKSITNVPNMYLVRHKDSLATLAPRGTPPHRHPTTIPPSRFDQVYFPFLLAAIYSRLPPSRRFAQVSDLFVVRLNALLGADLLLFTNVTTKLIPATTSCRYCRHYISFLKFMRTFV